MNVKKLTKLFCELAKLETSDCLHAMTKILQSHDYQIDICPKEHYAICSPPIPHAVALVAHCDTVCQNQPTKFTNKCGVISVKGGGILGADDRAGCTAIAASVLAGNRPQVYLLTGEERGGIGADHLAYGTDYSPPDTLHVLLELDRQGSNDYVTYDCESRPLNKWIERFGWSRAIGSFTDICTLSAAWEIAGANLSVGYYDQHTRSEHLIIQQLSHTIARVGMMLANPPPQRIDYVEAPPIRVSGYGSLNRTTRKAEWELTLEEELQLRLDMEKP